MESYYIDKIFGCQCIKISLIVDNRVINRNGSDHGRTLTCQLTAERNGISMRRKIHDSVCSHVDSFHYFLHLYIIVLAVSGYTKVYVDLSAEHGAYTLRIDTFMIFICTDCHLTGGYQRKQLLCCHSFFLSYNLKFRCDDAFTGSLHLCTVISHVKKSPFISYPNLENLSLLSEFRSAVQALFPSDIGYPSVNSLCLYNKKPVAATHTHHGNRLLILRT